MSRRRSDLLLHLLLALLMAAAGSSASAVDFCKPQLRSTPIRQYSTSVADFGGVGDGVTLNTRAFQDAVSNLSVLAGDGGVLLLVPAGRWLTGSFSLVSHLTLWLDEGAVILGSTDSSDWPLVDPLPSYGRGRELPGKRHQSLIFGTNLTDIVITGANGTVDGQGGIWWDWFNNRTLNYTRPHLVELMYSDMVIISNLTLVNSPFWTIHPVYSSQVLIHHVTVLAPQDSPNTDAFDPDSCTNVCIEDCYVSNGDDVVVVKSGWDEYGISFGRPSVNISVARIVGQTRSGAGVAIGSEMSGGICNVIVKGLRVAKSNHGIRVKTSAGRGGYIRNLYVSDVVLTNVSVAIRITGGYGEHPDNKFNLSALPVITGITIRDVVGDSIGIAGILQGMEDDEFTGICLTNISLGVKSRPAWNCSAVVGYSDSVSPEPCELLRAAQSDGSSGCYASGGCTESRLTPSSASRLTSPWMKLWHLWNCLPT